MKYTFDTRIFLLICCLLQGLAGLRLVKVSIPAYKLRGESAFLECQYELNRPYGSKAQTRNRHNQHGGGGGAGTGAGAGAGGGGTGNDNGNDMNYIETDSAGDEIPLYRKMRTYPYQHQQQLQQHQHQQQQQQQQQQPQHIYQQYQPQRASSSSSSSYYQQQQQQQYQQPQQRHYEQQPPYQTQQSPYGHSVYRGSSSSSSSSAYGVGRVGASTYTGGSTGSHMTGAGGGGAVDNERDDSFADSAEDEQEEEDSEALYAIKWYKDNEEFYRYVPKANPPKTSYRPDGVRVIEEHSDSSRVLLRGLTLNSTGLYRCEVSAEAPNFSSVQGEGRMDIVYLPRDGPHIKGQQFQYQIGETLNLNCTSGKSHPASHLQWFINEQPVIDGRYLVPYNDTVHKHGLITSTLGLQLIVDARHFHNGAMRVKCLASISPVLWKGGKESVLQRRPGIIDNREAMLLVRSSTSSLLQHQCFLLSSLRLLTITAILTRICQLLLRTELT